MPAQETQCRSKQLVKDEIRSVALTKMIFSRAFSVFHIFKQHKSLFSSPKEKCSIAMTRTCAMGTTARIFNRPTMKKNSDKGIRGLEWCANSSHRSVESNLLERASHLATREPTKISTFLP
jgi:hypothetical protein